MSEFFRKYHGLSKTPEYRIWKGIIKRCENHNAQNFKHYGGRGISIWSGWRKDFKAFVEHIGPRPSALHSVERDDHNGNYEPGNVRWATQEEQTRNCRRNVHVTAFGKTKILADWARESNFESDVIHNRIKSGWTPEDAMTIPLGSHRKTHRYITLNGKTQNCADWSRETGVSVSVICDRLKRSLTPEEVLRHV